MKIIIEIAADGIRCGKCRFCDNWSIMEGWECVLFRTREDNPRVLKGDPPRRCRQCLDAHMEATK